jgi:hypothetical protein
MDKERVLEVVEEWPDNVDLDALIERLYLLRRLEIADEEIAEGKLLEQEEVERRMAPWLE